jgi:hypothetical protein
LFGCKFCGATWRNSALGHYALDADSACIAKMYRKRVSQDLHVSIQLHQKVADTLLIDGKDDLGRYPKLERESYTCLIGKV